MLLNVILKKFKERITMKKNSSIFKELTKGKNP